MKAWITEDNEIHCDVPVSHNALMKTVPGAKWSNKYDRWRLPLTWSSFVAMRNTFASSFLPSPDLEEWAVAYRTNTVEPAMRLRVSTAAFGKADADLFSHQGADVEFLALVKRAILTNHPGTGKTRSAIRSLAELVRRGEDPFPLLVIAPKTMIVGWTRELEKSWPGIVVAAVTGTVAQRRKALAKKAHAYIMTFESVASHSRVAPYGSISLKRCQECGGYDPKITAAKCQVHKKELNSMEFNAVIVDEAHRIKNPKAVSTRAIKAAAGNAWFRLAMTGTPHANSILDVWSLLNFIDPKEWPSRVEWMDRYVNVVENFWGGIAVEGLKPETLDEFHEVTDYRIRRMTRAVVLPFLPPLLHEVRTVELAPKQKAAYNALAKSYRAELESGDPIIATEEIVKRIRLLQLSSSYGEIENIEKEDGTIGQKLHLLKPSSKIAAFMEDIEEFSETPTIIFCVSSQFAQLVSEEMDKANIPHRMIKGGQTTFVRQCEIDDFQDGKVNFIIVVISAGGEAITLTAADTMVYLQREQSLIKMEQSIARAYRIGSEQHKAVLRVDYVASTPVEAWLTDMLDKKFENAEEFNKDRELLKMVYGDV